jgi:hypothetical protein
LGEEKSDQEIALRQQLLSILRNATNSAHSRCARIIGIRKKVPNFRLFSYELMTQSETDLPLSTLCLRLESGLDFIRRDEERCAISLNSIRAVLIQQAKEFASQQNAVFTKQLISALDQETWQATAADRHFQKFIDRQFGDFSNLIDLIVFFQEIFGFLA